MKKLFIIGLCMILLISSMVIAETTIQLQTPNTENLDDGYADSATAGTEWGALFQMEAGNLTTETLHPLLKFVNPNPIKTNNNIRIIDSTICLYVIANGLDSAAEGYNISNHRVYTDFDWTEGTGIAGSACTGNDYCWNNKPTPVTEYNTTFEETIKFFGGAGEQSAEYICWNSTRMVKDMFNNNEENLSILFISNNTFGSPSPGGSDNIDFASKEDLVTTYPYLNITYEFITPYPELILPNDAVTLFNDRPDFIFTVNDTQNPNCTLYVDSVSLGISNNVTPNTETTFNLTTALTNTTHQWWVNCSNNENTTKTVERTITINPQIAVNFTIIDLSNNSILNHQNVNIELSGFTRTYNFNTSTGNVFTSGINSDTYTIRTDSSGFDETFIQLTPANGTVNEVTIYMDSGKTSKLFLTIDGSTNQAVANTTLTFTRNVNGTFVTTTQVITDFSGAAIVLLNENITYTFTAINDQYEVFTGDVNPATSTTFTVDLTLAGGTSYESFLNFLIYNTLVINNGSQLNISLSTVSTIGIIEWFSINATYNNTSYFTNVSGSPGGGTALITVPGVTTNTGDDVSVIYGIKANSYPSWKWNEVSLILLLNATNTTIMTGLFNISDDDITINGRAIIAMFFVILVLGGLTAASRSITIGAVGGIITLGVMILPQVNMLPVTYGSVSIIVLLILLVGERATGGAV